MNKKITFLFLLIAFFCQAQYTWIKRTDFPDKRFVPYSFSINEKVYVGGGRDSMNNPHRDLWEFDPQLNTWTQKASLPVGMERYGAKAFVISGKAYIVAGWKASGSPLEFQDVWEYNPAKDTFIQKNDLPLTFPGRYGYGCFTIGNKGYLGLGYGGYKKDFASYDPTTDTWTSLADLPGDARQAPTFFAIGNYGYMGMGISGTGYYKDFYKYAPSNNTWTALSDFPGDARFGTNTFVLNGRGYMIGGSNYSVTSAPVIASQVWEFNPSNNSWTQLANIADSILGGASASNSSYGFVGLGAKAISSLDPNNLNKRFWQYGYPLSVDELSNTKFTIFIHSDKKVDIVFDETNKSKGELTVVNMNGQVVSKTLIDENIDRQTIDLSKLSVGIYIINISCSDFNYSKKLLLTN